jgi:hypothetical protein
MPAMSGLELARRFYVEAVLPIVEATFPGLVHSAARIGRGSEVLGFDDRVSRDHDWGPRLEFFLAPADRDRCAGRLVDALAEDLPSNFLGHSTSLGSMTRASASRSRSLRASQVRDLMRLCLLMERQYPPYSKWLGSAFGRLDCAGALTPVFTSALRARDAPELQRRMAAACEAVAARHNELGITEQIDAPTRPFWTRGYPVLLADRFVTAIHHEISGSHLRDLPLIGSVDQFVDSTDVLGRAHLARAAATAALGGR